MRNHDGRRIGACHGAAWSYTILTMAADKAAHPLAGTVPSKIIAVHLSYRSRAMERGRLPLWPSYFLKPPSTLAGDRDVVRRPPWCELLAFEGEVALVIGTRASRVTAADAWGHVRWVTAANDFGVYDLRYADNGSNVRSKGIDGFTPIGPGLLDARTVDPEAIQLRTWVNGELAQDAISGDDLLFSFADIVADISRLTTLEPGDVILTGTPTGATVVRPGDLVEVEVSAPAWNLGRGGPGEPQTTGRLHSPIDEADYDLSPPGAMPSTDDVQREAAYGARGAPGPSDYYGATHPAVLGRRHVPWEVNATIACAGVTVTPGDIIVGDGDGVLVVPAHLAMEVARDAAEQERQEEFAAEMVAKGESVDGLYPLGKRWQLAYESWQAARDRPGEETGAMP